MRSTTVKCIALEKRGALMHNYKLQNTAMTSTNNKERNNIILQNIQNFISFREHQCLHTLVFSYYCIHRHVCRYLLI